MTTEMVRGVRMQSIEADQALAGLVGRLLRRRRTGAPAEPDTEAGGPAQPGPAAPPGAADPPAANRPWEQR
jgi:hypothetical protein